MKCGSLPASYLLNSFTRLNCRSNKCTNGRICHGLQHIANTNDMPAIQPASHGIANYGNLNFSCFSPFIFESKHTSLAVGLVFKMNALSVFAV